MYLLAQSKNPAPVAAFAGVDEAGRGCLAGPVVAAAVVLPPRFSDPGLHDSKQLKAAERERLRLWIQHNCPQWAVALATVEEIGEINILQASMLAMRRAVRALAPLPQLLLVDGNRFQAMEVPHRCIIGGDASEPAIAAASILAKTYRDALMLELAQQVPGYGWEQNKGYPTQAHRRAIETLGPTVWHRPGFRLLKQDSLFRGNS